MKRRATTSTKKAAVKKAPKAKKEEFSLNDIATGLKDFEFKVFGKNEDKVEKKSYIIKFFHLGLQKITGGILGSKFIEISGNSSSGKSFLAYELAGYCQKMGGYVLLFDGERAFEDAYADMVGLDLKSGTFSISYERDMDRCFALKTKFIKHVRAKKRNAPILIIKDSYAAYACTVDLTNMEKGANPRGYMHMQKNARFSSHIDKFVPFLDETDSTFVLLNQTRTKTDEYTGKKITTTLCEEVIQFWATQRIQGVLVGRLVKQVPSKENKKKGVVTIETGIKTRWKTIKNRAVKPFQTVVVKMRFSKGLDKYSGLDEVLINEGRITFGKSAIDKSGEKLKKPVEVLKHGGKTYYSIEDLVEENPSLLEPYWTGTYDEGEDEVEEELEKTDAPLEDKEVE